VGCFSPEKQKLEWTSSSGKVVVSQLYIMQWKASLPPISNSAKFSVKYSQERQLGVACRTDDTESSSEQQEKRRAMMRVPSSVTVTSLAVTARNSFHSRREPNVPRYTDDRRSLGRYRRARSHADLVREESAMESQYGTVLHRRLHRHSTHRIHPRSYVPGARPFYSSSSGRGYSWQIRSPGFGMGKYVF
jgi:hypothetical protein